MVHSVHHQKKIKINTFWDKTVQIKKFPSVNQHLSCDVIVIGSGMTGISTAYTLSKAGLKVILVDQGTMTSGDTVRTTAHLTAYPDWGISELLNLHGRDTARLAIESHMRAIDDIEENVKNEKLSCHFERVDAYLFPAAGETSKILETEMKSLESIGTGLIEAELEEHPPHQSYLEGPVLRIKNQARIHMFHYLDGMIEVLLQRGVQIFNESHIIKLEHDGVWTDAGYKITAPQIVVATHAPIEGTFIFLKQAPYRTYVLGAPIPKGTFHDGLFWDTEDPYHYIRTESLDHEHDLLIVGGEDHKTGQAPEHNYEQPFQNLEDWTRKRYPMVKDISYRWSGQVMEPMDGLAFIGKIPYRAQHIYMATGYSGNGITYGSIAASLLSDLILEKPNPWKELYDPTRKTVKAAGAFMHENLNMAKQFTKDRIKPDDQVLEEDLRPGEGGVIQKGIHQLAVYREETGELHVSSAVCPHLGCIVHWNGAEKTFDCPCHGSRFSPKGCVLTGPAIKNLTPQ